MSERASLYTIPADMAALVERLGQGMCADNVAATMDEASRALEQQAARIAELEDAAQITDIMVKTAIAERIEANGRAEALSAKVAEQDSEIVGLRGLLRRSRKEVRDDEIRILWNIAQDAKARAEAAERELAVVKKEAGFLRAALRVNTMRSGATNEETDALLKKAKEHGEQKDGGNG